MLRPYNILFLSSGSACRSQIARGWCAWYGRPVYDVQSAGLTANAIDEYAITVMKEIGVDISGQASLVVDQDMIDAADIVVTLDSIADEQCPGLPDQINREHWALEYPVIKDSMSDDELIQSYRILRDDIKVRVVDLISRLNQLQYDSFQPFSRANESAETAVTELH